MLSVHVKMMQPTDFVGWFPRCPVRPVTSLGIAYPASALSLQPRLLSLHLLHPVALVEVSDEIIDPCRSTEPTRPNRVDKAKPRRQVQTRSKLTLTQYKEDQRRSISIHPNNLTYKPKLDG